MNSDSNLRWLRILSSVLVVGLSILGAFVIWKLKPETETRPPEKPVLVADLIPAVATDIVVEVTAHGVARPIRVVTLTSEVTGRVINMPRSLHAGDRVQKGEPLLSIDPVDYRAAVQEAQASIARLDATLQRLETTRSTTESQVEVTRRSRDLAKADFDRLNDLSRQGNAVSKAVAEAAERTLAQAEVQLLQLEQTLELLPSQLEETKSERAAALARLERAETQLARTTVTAPFTARIVQSRVEENSFVAPGTPMFEIADDSRIEIQVPVQASELSEWIPFSSDSPNESWFPAVDPIEVDIEWTGSDRGYTWSGRLDRVVSFDATTRTAMLAVRVSGKELYSEQDRFPLSDGMFCRVTIPGKTLKQVFALPREAVSFDNQAYISDNGFLKTVDVTVAWSTKDTAYVSEGIQEGDLVVGTRLVAPLEGVQLRDIED